MEMIALPQVGQKCQFDPYREVGGMGKDADHSQWRVVTGRIIYVNYRHRWFLAQYGEHGKRTSFKFCDIGKLVAVHGLKLQAKKADNRGRPPVHIQPEERSKHDTQAKPVICLTTGKIYPSASIAAKLNGVARSNVTACCRGEAKSRNGLEWAWIKG